MDAGTRQHIYITLYLTGLGGLINLYVAIIGYALACGIFIGRELSQAEYRWIEKYGDGLRSNLPRFGCLDRRVWDYHSYAGVFAPMIFGGLYFSFCYAITELVKKLMLGGH